MDRALDRPRGRAERQCPASVPRPGGRPIRADRGVHSGGDPDFEPHTFAVAESIAIAVAEPDADPDDPAHGNADPGADADRSPADRHAIPHPNGDGTTGSLGPELAL